MRQCDGELDRRVLSGAVCFVDTATTMSVNGVLFTDTFDLESIDFDHVSGKKEKKFDKGKQPMRQKRL